jgi:CHAT domain-containing protein/tetratricopeptide (TPR) repeat protein
MSRCVALFLILVSMPVLAQEQPKPHPALTKEQQEKLKERDRFAKEAENLGAEGKLKEAVEAAEKVLAIERAVFGDVHEDVAGSLEFLAELHGLKEDFPTARKLRQEVLAIKTKLLGEQRWQVIDARLALEDTDRLARMVPADRHRLDEAGQLDRQAVQLYQQGKTHQAIPLAQKAVEIRKQTLGERNRAYATSLNNLALMYKSQAEYDKAEPLYRQVLEILKRALGERHPHYASSLNNLAGLYESQGEYAKAEPLCRQALDIRKQTLGERHPIYASSLNNLAKLYYSQGEYAKAEPLCRQALEIRKQTLGERHPDYAESLEGLATLYNFHGEYTKAEPLYRQALEIRNHTLGEQHPLYAISLNNLAGLYHSQGEYAKAEPLYRQALEIRKQTLGERHPDYAQSLNNLAGAYDSQGEYAKAERLCRQALEIYKQTFGERHPDYATSLNNLAKLYVSQGQYAKAERLCRQALEIYKQTFGERHPNYATSLDGLATLYYSQGEYAKAESLCRQALEIRKQTLGERHPDYAETLNNLAGVYDSQGEYAKAEPLYRQALEIFRQTFGERHRGYARSLNNLAKLYHDQEEYTKAEPLYRQALEIRKQTLGERHPNYAETLNNLAGLYVLQGQHAKAESLFRQALEIGKQTLGEQHPHYAESLNNLAALYLFKGEHAKAEPLCRQAIAALCQRPDGPRLEFAQLKAADLRPLPDTVLNLANYSIFLEQRLGSQPSALQLRAADRAFALTLAVGERLRQEVLEKDTSKLLHDAEAWDLIPRRIGICRRLFDCEGQADTLETAYAVAEQGTARVFLEQLGKARAHSIGQVNPALRDREERLRQQLRAFETRIAKEQDKRSDYRDPHRVGQLLEEQKHIEGRLEQLIRQMEKDYPQYAALKYPKPCSLAEARACLAANEVALLFVPGGQHSYVLLVDAQPTARNKAAGLAVYTLPSRDEIADGTSSLHDIDILALPVKVRSYGEQLYQQLLAPLKERLRGKDLVIVPGGPLCYVPFELLVEDGKYLIERHRIRYAPSLTALHMVRLWQKSRIEPPQPLFALGDPIYDANDARQQSATPLAQASQDRQQEVQLREGRVSSPFKRLVFSGQEVQAIAKQLQAPPGSVLTGAHALEANVKQASASGALALARYVHFATHGILGLDTGQQPALVLSLVGNDGQSDADGGLNDGFLRLDEVTRLRLNADLVVLSACRTGQGRLYSGEGVTGLARAFLYAGSRGVVSSLWSVDDRETASLMTSLYAQLQHGREVADALRLVKLQMISAGKPPLYWAPFILMGE